VHEIVDATPMPSWAYVVPKTLAMAVVLDGDAAGPASPRRCLPALARLHDVELGKYLLWYVLPATWDVLLLAALAVFVQALSPHKTVGWAVMVVFLIWQQLNKAVDHNLLNYGASPGMPLSDMNGAGSFWRARGRCASTGGRSPSCCSWPRTCSGGAAPRSGCGPGSRARRRLRGAPGGSRARRCVPSTRGRVRVLQHQRPQRVPIPAGRRGADGGRVRAEVLEVRRPAAADDRALTLDVALYPGGAAAVTTGRYVLRNLTPQPIPRSTSAAGHDDLELARAPSPARGWSRRREYGYRIYRLDRRCSRARSAC
jgi:hypothetical protein